MNATPSQPVQEPGAPQVKRGWKKHFAVIFGIIGVVASTSTVVGLVQGWFDPEPDIHRSVKELQSQQQQAIQVQQAIKDRLVSEQEDGHLVNQVSRRVTELKDEFLRIRSKAADIRRLDEALSAKPKVLILTPEQKKLQEASRKKEIEELLAMISETRKLAERFVSSVEGDATLAKVESADSESARTKARAIEQVKQIRGQLLPELAALATKHKGS
ncbi:MAG: hypothetical protein JXR96_27320 [Deltaproteobacteria bacterium]|nr:hypothetical protein [Deltaproteobacteria bacterium]